MRHFIHAVLLLPLSAFAQTWTQLPDFPGIARDDAASFVIGGKIYVGTGMDVGFQLTSDWWCFDPATNAWTSIAAMPTAPRQYCTGFTIADTGYVFGGVDANGALDELWAYDPGQSSWVQKTSMPAEARYACVAVTGFYTNAIVATGMLASGTPTNEAWKYHADTDTWEAITSVPGPARHRAACFLDNGGMHIVGGADADNNPLSDAWSYPIWFETGDWSTAPDLPAPRFGADGSGGEAMVLTAGATSNSEFHDDTWMLSGASWTSVAAFPGGPRRGGVGANRSTSQFWNTEFYYGLGLDGTFQRRNDWWRLDVPVGIAENNAAVTFSLAPVPADQELVLSTCDPGNRTETIIADIEGRILQRKQLDASTTTFTTASLANGSYVMTLRSSAGVSSRRFMVLH